MAEEEPKGLGFEGWLNWLNQRFPIDRDADVTMAEGKAARILVAPLNSVSYTGLEEPLEANAADLYVSAPVYESRHQSVANYFTVELTVLKEMSQALADLFGLRLPVSWKQHLSECDRGHRFLTYPQ
jgi:hypothetical protein